MFFFKLDHYLLNRLLIPKAIVISMACRVIFIPSILVLPIPKGILQKGLSVILKLIIIDTVVNGLVIRIPFEGQYPLEKEQVFA